MRNLIRYNTKFGVSWFHANAIKLGGKSKMLVKLSNYFLFLAVGFLFLLSPLIIYAQPGCKLEYVPYFVLEQVTVYDSTVPRTEWQNVKKWKFQCVSTENETNPTVQRTTSPKTSNENNSTDGRITLQEQARKQHEKDQEMRIKWEKTRGVFNPTPCVTLLTDNTKSDNSNKSKTAVKGFQEILDFQSLLSRFAGDYMKIPNVGDSPYSNVFRNANGSLSPASGYQWANSNNPNGIKVEPMSGLTEIKNGLCPQIQNGYRWVDPDNLKDFRVERIP